jgi:short-subunit dehydrogenase
MNPLPSRPLALVTGGSSGIGFELARELAGRGHDLVLCAQDADKLFAAAEILRGATDAEIDTVAADLATAEGVEMLYRSLQGMTRPVELFCANAGVGVGGGDFLQTDLDEELRLIDLNVRGQVQLTKLVARDMAGRGAGRILITASISGLMPGPFETVYSASKAFMRSFGEALRNELAGKGIVVTVLMPGPTDTDFFRRAHMEGTPVGDGKKDDPADVARQGLDALMADRHSVVSASLKTKTQAAATNLMSDPMLAQVHRRMSEPTAAQAARPMSGATLASLAAGALAAAAATRWYRHRRQA